MIKQRIPLQQFNLFRRKIMRNDRIVPGAVLIMIGAIILLHNYGYATFHIMNLIYLLPILIVVAGINLIFGHNKQTPLAVAIKLLVIGLL